MKNLIKIYTRRFLLLSVLFASILFHPCVFADVDDAFSYPATLTLLDHRQAVGSLFFNQSRGKFTGTVTDPTFLPTPLAGTTWSNDTMPMQNFFIGGPVNDKTVFSLGLTSPTDLASSTTYDKTSILRYNSVKTFYQVQALVGAMAFRLPYNTAVGVGVDYYKTQIIFNSDFASFPPAPSTDSVITTHSKSGDLSWHASFGGLVPKTMTIGQISYRPAVAVHPQGDSQFILPNGFVLFNSNTLFIKNVFIPQKLRIKLSQPISKKFWTSFEYAYTWWSMDKALLFYNVAGAVAPATQLLNWQNTRGYTLGLTLYPTDPSMVYSNIGYIESLYPHAKFYYSLELGAQYQFFKNLKASLEWTHYFNNKYPPTSYNSTMVLAGQSSSTSDYIGTRVVLDF